MKDFFKPDFWSMYESKGAGVVCFTCWGFHISQRLDQHQQWAPTSNFTTNKKSCHCGLVRICFYSKISRNPNFWMGHDGPKSWKIHKKKVHLDNDLDNMFCKFSVLAYLVYSMNPFPRCAKWIETHVKLHGPSGVQLAPSWKVLLYDYSTGDTTKQLNDPPSKVMKEAMKGGHHLAFPESWCKENLFAMEKTCLSLAGLKVSIFTLRHDCWRCNHHAC